MTLTVELDAASAGELLLVKEGCAPKWDRPARGFRKRLSIPAIPLGRWSAQAGLNAGEFP